MEYKPVEDATIDYNIEILSPKHKYKTQEIHKIPTTKKNSKM